MHQIAPNLKHFGRPYTYKNYKLHEYRLRDLPLLENKFANFGIFGVLGVRNPQIWPDLREIWQGPPCQILR